MIALVWQGGETITNVGELAIIIAGFGATLGHQIGSSMKGEFGSFLWSIGFSATILAAFLIFAILQDQSVAPILFVILGTSLAGFATLVLSGEIEELETLERFVQNSFRWLGAGLLVLHISVAYLYPSAGFVLEQLTSGVTNANLVTTWLALLFVVLASIFIVHHLVRKEAPNYEVQTTKDKGRTT